MTDLDVLDYLDVPALALGGADRRVLFWNDRIEYITSIARGEALGRSLGDLFGSMAADEHPGKGDTADIAIRGLGDICLRRAVEPGLLIGTLAPVRGVGQRDADPEREAFLGMATHDMRAPLRNIGFLCDELLSDGAGFATDMDEKLRLIRDISARAMALSDEVIASAVDLCGLCDVIFAMLDPEGRHDLQCVPATVLVERPVLQIALRNLVDNAIRHGGRDRVSLRIMAEKAARHTVRLTVTDNGKGFSDPARAFLAGGDLRYDSGFGLVGLRSLIRARSGTLAAEPSETGPGSVITVTLPGHILVADQPVARAS